MFATGLIDDGLSSVPVRTTVSPTRPVESANRWLPHLVQKRLRTRFPLSPGLVYSAGFPLISIDSVGKIALTVPFDEICWQSRHQQILETTGSAVRR